jgi:uncharacterized RDD family membrane protein YckC
MARAVPAGWIRRVNAATLDFLVCVAAMLGALLIAGDSVAARSIRIALVFLPSLLLEPILIRSTGATVGQRLLGLRVTPAPPALPGARLGFPKLLARYWTKLALGSLSLAYVVFSGRRQALHDRWFGTLVWHVPAGEEASRAGWREPLPDIALPAPWRRFAAFLGWSLLGQVVYAIVFVAAVAGSDAPVPSPYTELTFTAGALVLESWLLHRGANGRLPGARRRAAPLP